MDKTRATQFPERFASAANEVRDLLCRLISDTPLEGETVRPAQLVSAMRHGVLNGGKRFRPFLVIECSALLGGNPHAALQVAAALECVHCYSLVHDDLPAMDDDDLRRGQPTVHVAFDEATAILAGDALLTLAFDILTDDASGLALSVRIELVRRLARASGVGGMVGGQALDLAAERNTPDEAGTRTLQSMKTGALLRFACEAGALVARATGEDLARMSRFGELVGNAFQLADDLLDVTSDAATLGKAAGKDAGRGKATFIALHGPLAARRTLEGLISEACELLLPYGERSAVLAAAARYIAEREH